MKKANQNRRKIENYNQKINKNKDYAKRKMKYLRKITNILIKKVIAAMNLRLKMNNKQKQRVQ